ncbi:hypothetical protein HWV07_03185 [Natronomonas salina]|uniref:D-glucuronyl C5-epimerase family protein n=1 Tax=Natronomonas salina TaxID=1710540 RepID=UPI0015B6A4F1|nr:D-glucuronyl C5-epimerase family protein [Natronomonas salina]QLD88097.1 hypothetical protein HWV07_03185 [Natronomonas salina]
MTGQESDANDLTRRALARRVSLAASGSVLLAGCTTDADDDETPTPEPTTDESPTPEPTTEESTPDETRIAGVPVERRSYDLAELPYERRPQFFGDFRRDEPECLYSVERVQRVDDLQEATVGDQTGHFPLRSARWLLRLLHCYRVSGDEGYLDRAEEMSEAFLEDAVTDEAGTPYFPYRVDKGGSSTQLEAPWFSGMVQGVALSAYTYFHELTGEDRHRENADRVFRSFTTLDRHTDGPWTSMVDDGYYWIEEYPADPPTHVLNGYCVGLWGVYDYWLHTRSAESRAVLEASLTTLEDTMEKFRVPGEVSYYGLDSYNWYENGEEAYSEAYRGNQFYHDIHIAQLDKLHQISNEDYFGEMQDTFVADSPPEEEDEDEE